MSNIIEDLYYEKSNMLGFVSSFRLDAKFTCSAFIGK